MKDDGSLKTFKFGDKLFDIVNTAIMVFVVAICVYPFYYCVVISFNEGSDAMKGYIYFFPRVFTLKITSLPCRTAVL